MKKFDRLLGASPYVLLLNYGIAISRQQLLWNLTESVRRIIRRQIENPGNVETVSRPRLRDSVVTGNPIGDSGNGLMFPGDEHDAVLRHGILDHIGVIALLKCCVDLDPEFFGQRHDRLLGAQAVAMLADTGGIKELGNGKPFILQTTIRRIEEFRERPRSLPAARDQRFRILIAIDIHTERRAGIGGFFGMADDHDFFRFHGNLSHFGTCGDDFCGVVGCNKL
jgi:hypothetical protein